MDVRAEIDFRRIEAFVHREARFADENRYDDWLSLWLGEGAVYWVPANKDDYDPRRHVSIIYDNWERLQDRVDRLKSGAAWSQEPRSRMRRIVSNIEVEEGKSGEIVVRSNFVLGELRRELQTVYFAGQIHHLRTVGSDLKMSFKKVMLIANDEPIHNLSFLV